MTSVGRTLAWVQRKAPPLAPCRAYGPAPMPDPRWRHTAAELTEAAEGLTRVATAALEGDEFAKREWGSGAAMRAYHRAMNR